MENPKMWLDFVTKLNSLELSGGTYVLIALTTLLASLLGVGLGAFIKEKVKIDTITANFDILKEQLEQNTEATKRIEASFTEKVWISQQIWQKKYEIYESIYLALSNIKKWVDHESNTIELHLEPQRLEGFLDSGLTEEQEQYIYSQLQQAREQLEKTMGSPGFQEKQANYHKIFVESIEKLTDLLVIKAFILSNDVSTILAGLPQKFDNEFEDWDELQDYQERIVATITSVIKDIKKCAQLELKI